MNTQHLYTILVIATLVGIIFAWVRIIRSDAGDNSKSGWMIVVLLFSPIATIVWYFIGPGGARTFNTGRKNGN